MPALSLPDTFAITLAKVHGWVLLAGDAALRRLAAAEEIEHHGVLWVLDQLLHRRQADAQILQTALTEIAAHPRCRLPTREISERLDHYARLIGGRR